MKRQSFAFTVGIGNKENANPANFKLPLHIIQKMESRNKGNIKICIHDMSGQDDNNPIENMMNELIDRLRITQNYLSPTVLIDMITLIIRSYLPQELHIQLAQPLRYFIHSPFHPFGITLFPPRKHGITHPLVFNDKIQFQQLSTFQLGLFAFKFSQCVFIGNEQYPTLILSTPDGYCLHVQRNKACKPIKKINDKVIYIWKQDNVAAYVFTQKRVSLKKSKVKLFMITVSNVNGEIFVCKLIDNIVNISNYVDHRIFGAYYYTKSSANNEMIKNGFPSDNFLIIIGDLNIIITPHKFSSIVNEINLHCLWYFPSQHKFIGIERNKYHLVSIGLSKKSELFIMDKYRRITSTGIQHYFYDSCTDMIVIYKQLMASSKFKNELIFLPVSSQLMKPQKKIKM